MKILDKLWSSLTKRVDLHILIIFILVILLTRIPFICKYLFDWDSVGYALGFQQFNMALDQPQAPGYIFYVALGKIVNLIFNNPNDTMIFISIIFSIFTVILVYYLAKQIYSREVAVIASVLLIFFPTFWFYGETSTIYICEALFATLIAYTSYQLLKGDDRFLYISTFILGLSGGFRQDLILFMFPLWFFCLVYQDLNYKKIFKALIVLIASIMLWFIPTIILAGGYGNYSLINQDTLIGSFQSLSIFFGAGIVNQLSMDSRLLSWTVLGIGIISSLILWIFISLNLRRIIKVSNFRNPDLIFMFLWFLPAFLFYLLIYIAKPGYVLTFLPVFSLIIGYVIVNFSFKLNKRFKLVSKNSFILLLVSIIVFLSVVQFFIPGNVAGYSVIELKDMNIHYFNESLNEFNPNNTLIFYGFTDDYRSSMYYYPHYQSYTYNYYDRSGKTLLEIYHYQNHQVTIIKNQTVININSSTMNIVWFIDTDFYVNDTYFLTNLQSAINVQTMKLPDGSNIYYTPIKNNTNFTIEGITFIKN